MAWMIVVGLIVAAAAWILVRRVCAFVRTKGRSACSNCPYSGSCPGNCEKRGL